MRLVCAIIAHEKWYDEIFFPSMFAHINYPFHFGTQRCINLFSVYVAYGQCTYSISHWWGQEMVHECTCDEELKKISLFGWKFEMLSPKCANHFDEVRKKLWANEKQKFRSEFINTYHNMICQSPIVPIAPYTVPRGLHT